MKKRSWTEKQLEDAVKSSLSLRQVLKILNLRPTGGNYDQLKKYIQELKLSTAHFKGMAWNKGIKGLARKSIPLEKILIQGSNFQSFKLKNRLIRAKIKPGHCENCGWVEVTEDGHIPLELHHINGNRHDNRLENLKILCPNCHSLTPFHRGRGQKKW